MPRSKCALSQPARASFARCSTSSGEPPVEVDDEVGDFVEIVVPVLDDDLCEADLALGLGLA